MYIVYIYIYVYMDPSTVLYMYMIWVSNPPWVDGIVYIICPTDQQLLLGWCRSASDRTLYKNSFPRDAAWREWDRRPGLCRCNVHVQSTRMDTDGWFKVWFKQVRVVERSPPDAVCKTQETNCDRMFAILRHYKYELVFKFNIQWKNQSIADPNMSRVHKCGYHLTAFDYYILLLFNSLLQMLKFANPVILQLPETLYV